LVCAGNVGYSYYQKKLSTFPSMNGRVLQVYDLFLRKHRIFKLEK